MFGMNDVGATDRRLLIEGNGQSLGGWVNSEFSYKYLLLVQYDRHKLCFQMDQTGWGQTLIMTLTNRRKAQS